MWPLHYHHILAACKRKSINSKVYYKNTINMRISLDMYSSKIRRVSRHRPTVSNEIFLETKQEFFFTKVVPCARDNWHFIIGFLINTAPRNVHFILDYDLYFLKEFFFWMFIFQWLQYSNVLICLFVKK